MLLHLNTSWCSKCWTEIFIYIYDMKLITFAIIFRFFVHFFIQFSFDLARFNQNARMTNMWTRWTIDMKRLCIDCMRRAVVLKWISNQSKKLYPICEPIQEHLWQKTDMKMQQEQDCLQLNEQINTAFIRLIALSTDNFQVHLNEPIYNDMVSTVVQCTQATRFILSWSELQKEKLTL